MRRTASLLVIATACQHGRVVVSPSDIANHVGELNQTGRAEVPARKQRLSPNWSSSTTTIRSDQPVEVNLSSVETGDNELFTGFVRSTIGDLVADCPRTPFATDKPTRQANPRCKLLGAGDDSITVATTTYPGPIFWGAVGGSIGLGIAACATYCDSPYKEASIGVAVVGAVVGIVAIVAISALLDTSR